MKRDIELVRKLLLHFEENLKQDDDMQLCDIKLEAYTMEEIAYNIETMFRYGLITVYDASSSSGFYCIVRDITWQGHELLESIRSEDVWNHLKLALAPIGVQPFEAMIKGSVEILKTRLLK